MKAYLIDDPNYVIKVDGVKNYKSIPTPTVVSFWSKDENNNIFYEYGNVGIGTSIPNYLLTVNGDGYYNGNLLVSGTTTSTDFDSLSDRNLKENIRTLENPLEKILSINGVSFDWRHTKESSIGVIAQEIEEIFPELVNTNEFKSVNYNGLIGVLIEAIKELKTEVNELRSQINSTIRNDVS